MVGKMIWYGITFGAAALFVLFGVYAQKREAPMWFWAGSEVDAAQISDVKQYNKENTRMWQLYSLWYWVCGAAMHWSAVVAIVVMFLGCTVGIGILIRTFQKIVKTYRVQDKKQIVG